MFALAPEPKELRILNGTTHGTDMFKTDEGDNLTSLLMEFLEDRRSEL